MRKKALAACAIDKGPGLCAFIQSYQGLFLLTGSQDTEENIDDPDPTARMGRLI